MLRKYCKEHTKNWDHGVPFLLFTTRKVPQESLGFSLNEVVFVPQVRGPLSLVKDAWSNDAGESQNLLQYVRDFKLRFNELLELARENMRLALGKMKELYDRKAEERDFSAGDEVLVFQSLQGQPLAAY